MTKISIFLTMFCGKTNYGNDNAIKLKYVMLVEICIHVKKCA